MGASSYRDAGVREQGDALSSVLRHLGPTLDLPTHGRVVTDFGQYASVIEISPEIGIAISTDGVGSKTLIASAMDRYDSIGFDCMAMNVNDLICVGARPLALVDYLGVHTLDERRTDEILRGLAAAARDAGVAVPGGELAQLPEVIGSDGRVPGDEKAFDLVGTAVGIVSPGELIVGAAVGPGDVLIGIASSGIHSNGLTLARKVLLRDGGFRLDEHVESLGHVLGDELLQPTEIYVRGIVALWDVGIETKGLVHVTGDGLVNLCRLEAEVTYAIESLPPTPPIFELIQQTGAITDEEMYRVFNMGVGFVVVVDPSDEARTLEELETNGYRAWRLGRAAAGARAVTIGAKGLRGALVEGNSVFEKI